MLEGKRFLDSKLVEIALQVEIVGKISPLKQ